MYRDKQACVYHCVNQVVLKNELFIARYLKKSHFQIIKVQVEFISAIIVVLFNLAD